MTQREDITSLFTEYVNICNKALITHRDSFPYKQILAGTEKVLSGRNIGVAVYADDPNTPFDYFTLRFIDGTFTVVAHGKQEPQITWKVKRAYLEKVVAHPDQYINHPEKLDWDWIKSRIGLE